MITFSDAEYKVLFALWGSKASYKGNKNYRQEESELDPLTWAITMESLKNRGFVTKNNAIGGMGRIALFADSRFPYRNRDFSEAINKVVR